jgi:hypothetical protein
VDGSDIAVIPVHSTANRCNPIRRELGLPERAHYSSENLPGNMRSLFPGGGQQLRFRDYDRERNRLRDDDRYLRWQSNLVGGRIRN